MEYEAEVFGAKDRDLTQRSYQEGQAFFAVEGVLAGEDFLRGAVGDAKGFVHFFNFGEAGSRGGDGEDGILVSAFGEEETRSDEAGDVIALGPVENAGDVVIHAVGDAHDAVAEGVEIATDKGRFDASVEGGGELSAGAAAGDANTADAFAVKFGMLFDPIDSAHDIPYAPGDHGLTEQESGACRGQAGGLTGTFLNVGGIATATESHWFDRDGG